MPSTLVNFLLFHPPPSRTYVIPNEVFHVTTSFGNRIAATHIRRKGANVTLLYSHGNAEDLNTTFGWTKRLSKLLDVNVVAYDYTGYGLSDGSPSQKRCYADIEAVYHHLIHEQKLRPEQIVLYGRSLGSGPTCYLASKTAKEGRPVAGVILHSPFTSVFRVVFDAGLTLLGDKFPNIDRLGSTKSPVCIIHGRQDDIVPFEHGVALFRSIPEKFRADPFFSDDMDHNMHTRQVEYSLMVHLNNFLDYHILARQLWMRKQPEIRTKKSRYSERTRGFANSPGD